MAMATVQAQVGLRGLVLAEVDFGGADGDRQVVGLCRTVFGVCGRVAVRVVAEVLFGLFAAVPAIARHRRPAELERQQSQQEEHEPTAHGARV
jgi:hypothetical protein